MQIIKALPVILILLLCSGCIILPLPAGSQSMYAFKEKLKDISEGSTTREEVISIIGEPDIKLKKFILYKRRVQSGGAKILYWVGIPLKGTGITLASGSKRIHDGDWVDVAFEFDEQGVLTEYRFIDLGWEYAHYKDVTKCNYRCDLIYDECLLLTEEESTSLPQCEDTAETCYDQCNLIRIKHDEIDEDCDPGMESCASYTIETNASYEDGDPKDEKYISHPKTEDEEYISPPKTEEDCTWQFDSCMEWAENPQQKGQCKKEKHICLQDVLSCNKNYSSCLKKVGKAISSEQYCVEEKQKCVKKLVE